MSGFAEDHEQIALAGVLQFAGHVQIGIHARLEHGNASELVELRGVRVIAESAGDQLHRNRRLQLPARPAPDPAGKRCRTPGQ